MKAKNDEITADNSEEVVELEDDKSVNATKGNGQENASFDKEKDKTAEDIEMPSSFEVDVDDIPISDISAVSDTNEELQFKINDLNDRYLRLYSEFDNYRKRTLKERIEMSKTASEEVIRALLPVVDDIERALKSWDSAESDDVHLEGIKLISNKLSNILSQRGLEEIPAMGLPFNTDFHEAITQIPAPSPELKDKNIDVVEKGYLLHGKVIRFAKVVVGS